MEHLYQQAVTKLGTIKTFHCDSPFMKANEL